MTLLNIKISNSYGIMNFEHPFEFTRTDRRPHDDTHLIYAHNGVMKSSFAKTLKDYSTPGAEIKDHIFNIPGSCHISGGLESGNVYAVPSFDNSPFADSNVGGLVANEELRMRYDALTAEHTGALESLLLASKAASRPKTSTTLEGLLHTVCKEFRPAAEPSIPTFIAILREARTDFDDAEDFIEHVPYKTAGEPYVLDFVEKNGTVLTSFMNKYRQILDSSAYMRGDFGTKGATEVADVLKRQNFFGAEHAVTLRDMSNPEDPQDRTVRTADDLIALFNSDFDRVFEREPELKEQFRKILKKLDQANHADLKKLLEQESTRPLILLMNNSTQFRKKLWRGYFKVCREEIDALLAVDSEIAPQLEEITRQARTEKTAWDEAVEKFNRRFRHMPFMLDIENRASVILSGSEEPRIVYYYSKEGRDRVLIEREQLGRHLSTGERKALYLLNVIFELEARKKRPSTSLVVLDDIVDSFDYKNKYAFLEYIYELSGEQNNLFIILLTHNFDFFRLIHSRLHGEGPRDHYWFAERSRTGEVRLVEAGQFRHFENTKAQANRNGSAWVSLIPLARNLVEYSLSTRTQSDQRYQYLTECMHLLDAPRSVADIMPIIEATTGVSGHPYGLRTDVPVTSLITEEANNLPVDPAPGNILHAKTVLAMACRLAAEEFMKNELSSEQIERAKNHSNYFTRKLFEEYAALDDRDDQAVEILEEVNLITPENIHINAFMYEPLIDLSQDELMDLYAKLRDL